METKITKLSNEEVEIETTTIDKRIIVKSTLLAQRKKIDDMLKEFD